MGHRRRQICQSACRIAGALSLAITLAGAVSLLAQSPTPGVTPWQVGDVFVGVGSSADAASSGVYKTASGTGQVKLDLLGPSPAAAVPDLDLATSLAVTPIQTNPNLGGWTTGCFVDPTQANGDLWTTSWTDMILSHFRASDHTLIDTFAFDDVNAMPTVLAALPLAPGVAPLPQDAIGTISPNDPSLLTVVNPPTPAIQSFQDLIFSTSGPFAGQMYIGTGVPPDNSLGRGYGYLLRVAYNPNATGSKLTLTGWWKLDAGAIADRSADRLAVPRDAAILIDGSSNGAGGVDHIDLSSDQQTIFYTSQDPYVRRVNVVTGVVGTPIVLSQQNGTDPVTGAPIWAPILDARALGIRALPGKVDSTGTLDPTAAGDGSAGFLVASAGGYVYRIDQYGHSLYRYTTPGRPEPISIAPDAQYFWTATTQDDPFNPVPAGGFLYRFHVASGTSFGPFSPYGPPFPAGVSAQGHGVYGLCIKRQFFVASASADHQQTCFAMNADGSPQLDASGNPIPAYCQTPVLCSPNARGVALSPGGTPLPPSDPSNAACFPPGTHAPTYANQQNRVGDTVSVNLSTGNPGLIIDGAVGLPLGLTEANGIVSGTIDFADCSDTSGTCSHTVTVDGHFPQDVGPSGNILIRTNGTFTWVVNSGNAPPTISLGAGVTSPVTATVLHPLTIPLAVFDADADDVENIRASGLPPGMFVSDHTSYGDGFRASVSGTPAADPTYPHQYPVVIDVFDCTQAWTFANPAPPTVAMMQAAIGQGCFHHVSLSFTITITDVPPALNAPIADQYNNAGSAIAGLTIAANSQTQLLPISFTVTGLPVGLDYCHEDATGVCPVSSNPHLPVASNTNPATQAIRIFGVPTTPVTNAPVTVVLSDIALSRTQSAFHWTIHGAPAVAVANQFTLVNSPASYRLTATSPNGYPLTYTIAGMPAWLTFTSATQTFSGTAPANAGSSAITVSVTDQPPAGQSSLTTTQSFTWTVRSAPTLTVQSLTSLINTPVSYSITPPASSPNGYPISLTATGVPGWLSFDPVRQVFAGTTPPAPTTATIVVTASDQPPPGQLPLTTGATFTWTVIANRPPVCSTAIATPALLWPPNHKLVPFSILNVTDPDGDPVGITITSITQDQPVNGTGSGRTPFDATGVGTSTGAVRAERSGNRLVPDEGRLYQVNFTANDGKPAGTCQGRVFIGVPHDQGQHTLPADNGCRWDSTTGAPLGTCAPRTPDGVGDPRLR